MISDDDYEVREVIEDEALIVFLGDEGIPSRIIQDTLEDLCVIFFEEKLLSRKECRKLFNSSCLQDPEGIRKKKLETLDHRLPNSLP